MKTERRGMFNFNSHFKTGFLIIISVLLLPLLLPGCADKKDSTSKGNEHIKTDSGTVASKTIKTAQKKKSKVEIFSSLFNEYLKTRIWKTHQEKRILNRETLLASLDLGRRYMINNQKPEGNFNYKYDFVKKEFDEGDSQVRQAGGLWGLSLVFGYHPDPETMAALDKGLRFFFEHTLKGKDGSLYIAYPGDDTSKTGANALVALSIIEYLIAEREGAVELSDSYHDELERYLGGYIKHLKLMRLDNRHFAYGITLRDGAINQKASPYFDGEVLLCLIKAAKYLGYKDLVPIIEESSIVIAKEYTVDQWSLNPDSNLTKGFFQWSCMAFWEYQDAGWKNSEMLRDYVLSMAWWMIYTHRTLQRNRNTAYAYEGIISAYRLAEELKYEEALHDLRYTIDKGLSKLTSWQVGGPFQRYNPFLMANPTDDPYAIGGIMNHRSEAPLRFDVTQHQMHSVILALKYVYKE
jgi:UDP-N-acetylmuramoyl-tripeptide--D-alanyl-D-alanine ligase